MKRISLRNMPFRRPCALVLCFLLALPTAGCSGCSIPSAAGTADSAPSGITDSSAADSSAVTDSPGDSNGTSASNTFTEIRLDASEETSAVSDEAETVYRLSIACATAIEIPDSFTCTDGSRIEFIRYENGILGTDEEMLHACQEGTVSLFMGASSIEMDDIPEISLMEIPYLLDDLEEYQTMISSSLYNWFQPFYQENGLQLLQWRVPCLGFITSERSVTDISDFSKLKIRSMSSSTKEIFWNALGAQVEQMSFDKLGYALQKKQINAFEAGLSALISSGYVDYMSDYRYLILTNHCPAIDTIVMNRDLYDALPENVQVELCELLGRCMDNAETAIDPHSYAEQYGLEVLEPDADLRRQLKEKGSAVTDALRRILGDRTVNRFLSYVEENRPQ